MCVHFWNSVEDYGYESLLQNRAVANLSTDVLYFRNLQWRTSSRGNVPRLYATEYTVVSTQPSESSAVNLIAEYKKDVTALGGHTGSAKKQVCSSCRFQFLKRISSPYSSAFFACPGTITKIKIFLVSPGF